MLAEQPELIQGRFDLDRAKLMADATQAPLLQLLKAIEAEDITQHAIINAISATVLAEKIAEIAARPDVERIWLDEKIYLPEPPIDDAALEATTIEASGETDGNSGRISGRVLCYVGAPVANATVLGRPQLMGLPWLPPHFPFPRFVTVTNATGHFLTPWRPPDIYEIIISPAANVTLVPTWVPNILVTTNVTTAVGDITLHWDYGDPIVNAPPMWAAGYDGRGIKIAILDTGIDHTHPDLVTRVIAARDFTDDLTIMDLHGHGTHVGGIAAGAYNPAWGITGVAPGAYLLNAKSLNRFGWGLTSWIVEAIEWSMVAGADILNMSFGAHQWDGTGRMPICLASANAVAAGHIVVPAAGNSAPGQATIARPAIAHDVIAVAGSDARDQIIWFSSRGPAGDGRVAIDVAAPGLWVIAPVPRHIVPAPEFGLYDDWSGTSMSAPHIAGAAALLLDAFPLLTPAEVETALKSTADDLVGVSVLDQGAGRLNVYAAYRALRGGIGAGILVEPHEWAVGRVLPGAFSQTFTVTNTANVSVTLPISKSVMTDTQGLVAGDWIKVPAEITVPAEDEATFVARMIVPPFTEGTYFGHITVGAVMGAVTIPVSVNVMQFLPPLCVMMEITGTVNEGGNLWGWGDHIYYTLDVQPGVASLRLTLDWGVQANDLDLVLFNPEGEFVAMSLEYHPEVIEVNFPMPGKWTAFVWAWHVIPRTTETYTLRIYSVPTVPLINLDPEHGLPGTLVTVRGGGFPAETLGVLYAIEPGGALLEFPEGVENLGVLPASVIKPIPFRTNEHGAFSVNVTILLDAPLGEATFVANVAGVVAMAPFRISPPIITLDPTDSYGGTEVTVTGQWFTAGAKGVIIAQNVINPVPFLADEDGKFEVTATILPDAPLGPATFKAVVGTTILATATFTVTQAPPFNFSLAVAPTPVSLTRGTNATATVNVTHLTGIPEQVRLTAVLPAAVTGISINFTPPVGTPDFTSTMTITTTAVATVGHHAVTIRGATLDGKVVREIPFTLIVEPPPFDFTLAVAPKAGLALQGDTVTAIVTATVRDVESPREMVTLTAELPARVTGIAVTFAPAAGRPNFTSTMTIAIAGNATLGEHLITIRGTGEAGHPVATTTFTLRVHRFLFDLFVSPAEYTIARCESVTATVTVPFVRGISGRVNLTTGPLPAGVIVTFAPQVGTPTFTSAMTINATANATIGRHTITIIGDAGIYAPRETATFILTVVPLDFTLALETIAGVIDQGKSATTTLFAHLVSNKTARVNLDYEIVKLDGVAVEPSDVKGIWVDFYPKTHGKPHFGREVSFHAARTATVGEILIRITGKCEWQMVEERVYYTLTVRPIPFDFGLAVVPVTAEIYQCQEVTANVTATHLAGITENVSLTAALPPGVTGIIITFVPSVGEPGFTSRMTVRATASATVGMHPITITGTGVGGLVTRNATFHLVVKKAPFDIEEVNVVPDEATRYPGENVSAEVTVTHKGAPIETISLSYQLPEGVVGIIVRFDPSYGRPQKGIPFTSDMTIEVTRTATRGEHLITINATGEAGHPVAIDTFTLTVVDRPFVFSLEAPPELTVIHGQGVEAIVRAIRKQGVPEYVTLSATVPPEIVGEVNIYFKPERGRPDFDFAMTIAATLTAKIGDYLITITGTGEAGAPVATTTFILKVRPPAPLPPPALRKVDIHLVEGWNLISLPLIPVHPAIEVVLAAIRGDVIVVAHYDAENEVWKVYPKVPDLPLLTEMRDGRGYWIAMARDATLTVSGHVMPPPGVGPRFYPVVYGWNHIGFASTIPMKAEDYLGRAVADVFVTMWGFDPAVEGGWFEVKLTDLLQPGRGYWLSVVRPATIYPPGH
jgi:subtilisin family serine protease